MICSAYFKTTSFNIHSKTDYCKSIYFNISYFQICPSHGTNMQLNMYLLVKYYRCSLKCETGTGCRCFETSWAYHWEWIIDFTFTTGWFCRQLTPVAESVWPSVQTDYSAVLRAPVVAVDVVARPAERRTSRTVVVPGAHHAVVEFQRRRRCAVVCRRPRPLWTGVQQVLWGVPPNQPPGTACK